MEFRDTRRSQEYFERYIEKREKSLAKSLKELESIEEERIRASYKTFHASDYEKLLWACYSAGYPVKSLVEIYRNWLENKLNSDTMEMTGSTTTARLLSFAILLGLRDEDTLTKLQRALDIARNKDPLVTFLAEYLGLHSDNPRPNKSWCKWYLKIRDIEGKEAQEIFTEEYLRRYWYNSRKQEAWWGYHRYEDEQRGNLYFGYWAFEIAAGVKVLGLDDSSFYDNKYYPGDLARYTDHKE